MLLLVLLVPLQASYAAAVALCFSLDTTSVASAAVRHSPAHGDAQHDHGGAAHDQTSDASDDECASVAHHACCPAIALPAAGAVLHPPPATAGVAAEPFGPVPSRFSDGLFRPPRTLTA